MRKEIKILVAIAFIVFMPRCSGQILSQINSSERQPTTDSRLVRPDSPTLGSADAPVTLVEFYDPECESCRAFHPTVKKILKDYDGKSASSPDICRCIRIRRLRRPSPKRAGEQANTGKCRPFVSASAGMGERHGPPQATPVNQTPPAELFQNTRWNSDGFDKLTARFGKTLRRQARTRQKRRSKSRRPSNADVFRQRRKLARLSEADLKSLIEEELKK
jgi:hypothetical protein